MRRMGNEPDVAQARKLLSELQDHIAHISREIEKSEMRRRPNSPATATERALRRDLYEAHAHVDRIHQRFPETAN